jgi:hypothetical protein
MNTSEGTYVTAGKCRFANRKERYSARPPKIPSTPLNVLSVAKG